ncbi:MAG TPA: hypothetical protein VFM21_11990 [Terriglobia bacterium]|nr:hypothetical protein [Terriglobia bacterium]
MLFVDFAKRLRSLEFNPLGANPPADAAIGDSHDPGKTNIHEHRRLLLLGQQPGEMHRAFIPTLDYANFFGASELFVTAQAFDRVPERSGGKRGDFDRVVTLDSVLTPEFETNRRVAADFGNAAIQSEKLLRGEENFLLVEQPAREVRLD